MSPNERGLYLILILYGSPNKKELKKLLELAENKTKAFDEINEQEGSLRSIKGLLI